MAQQLQVDLNQMVLALENVIDLVGITDLHHGKRVAYIALQIADQLGIAAGHEEQLFRLGMLHDCGVSSEQVHSTLVNLFDWEGAQEHCQQGYHLLCDFAPLADCALPIRYHHTHWSELSGIDLDAETKRLANLIFLADRVDISAAAHYKHDILLAREEIVSLIELRSGTFFDPELVAAFVRAAKTEAFWIALEDQHICRFCWRMCTERDWKPLDITQLRQCAYIFSYIVDQKSPFTANHSINVGRLARHLGELSGLSRERAELVEIAGYLHDLGKLRIPDQILDKPGPLSPTERSLIHHHSFETFEILNGITGLEEIARWAAYHHEHLCGTGYPFHPCGEELEPEAKLIAVADVLQALVQDRPYRKGMAQPEALVLLETMASEGQLDPALIALVRTHQDSCFRVARTFDWSS